MCYNTNVEIRECREGDWEQVWYLWQHCHLTPPPGCTSSRAVRCGTEPALSLIADSGGVIVGSAVGTWDGERAWICSVVVDPRIRRTSVARNLLQELENKLREKGAEYVITLVPKENLEAQVLFEAAGFEDLSNHIIMGKPLK